MSSMTQPTGASGPAPQPCWHCLVGGQRYGPITADALRAWAAEGRVNAQTPVWREGMSDWAPMASLPELAAGVVWPVAAIPQAPSLGESAGMRLLLPVGRSPAAIVAGYLGLLAIIPAVGLLAVGFAAWAIHDIRRNPKRHGMGRAIFGLVTGIMGIIFWAWFLVVRAGVLR